MVKLMKHKKYREASQIKHFWHFFERGWYFGKELVLMTMNDLYLLIS
jgi:hypothetical protein